MNNPFHYTPDKACDEAFRQLTDRLETLKKSTRYEDINFCRELEAGKMLGVLIAVDNEGENHTLYAFSGQLGDCGFHFPGFVGPVFDYLRPSGYFKSKESEISRQSIDIALYKEGPLSRIKNEYERNKERLSAEVSDYKEKCRLSKSERDAKRISGEIDEEERAALIRQSQFEKAELHRLKKRVAAELEPFALRLEEARIHLNCMIEKRRSDSEALQKWLFSNFRLLNARGENLSLSKIFADTSMKIPPSGAGECCAPKLLQTAYRQGWRPLAIAEYWYGRPKEGEIRIHGEYYPACRGKCLPILRWMLKGVDINPPLNSEYSSANSDKPQIIYENEWFCIVSKPAGMLSVPGKGSEISLQQWLIERFGTDRKLKMAHRLDQHTSGLIIATFGPIPFKVMQSLFAKRKIKKTYIAELSGNYQSRGIPGKGRIELPLSPDWLDRPRQRIDIENGKPAITDYEFLQVSGGRSRVVFHPLTGRTHQLRIHAVSEQGLGMPIVGDRLYGINTGDRPRRMLLHAQNIEFTFPLDGKHYAFEIPAPF